MCAGNGITLQAAQSRVHLPARIAGSRNSSLSKGSYSIQITNKTYDFIHNVLFLFIGKEKKYYLYTKR